MWKKFGDFADGIGWQARQDILQISEGIMAIEFGYLNQAHDGGSALAGTQATGEELVLPPGRNRANAVLDPVVVDGHLTIAKIMDQCRPAP